MNILATVEQIEEVRPHSNADKLELARVLNYWCIVPKDKYVAGNTVIYIRPDSILPSDREWATPFLRYTSRGRCRAIRLRGEWSEGIILGGTEAFTALQRSLENEQRGLGEAGEDVTNFLGLTKFEPPVPNTAGARRYLPYDIPRTDEERWQNLRNLDQLLGQEVVVTLKIDGQSFTAYSIDGDKGICSRSLELKIGDGFDSNWHAIERKYSILEKLDELPDSWNPIAIRGEVYGPTIQALEHNPHCRQPLNFAMYSIWDMAAKKYLDWEYVEETASMMGIPTVPVIERGVLTMDMINKYDSGLKKLNGRPFEGVVIKGKGFSFKIINKWYDSEK